MRVVTFINVLLLLMAIAIGGCAPVVHQEHSRDKEPTVLIPSVKSPTLDTRQNVESFLAQGNIVQAHRELLEARRRGAPETSSAETFIKVENLLLQEAEQAKREDRFDHAGRFYSMVLNAYPKQPEIQSGLIMSRDEIAAQVERCADELMKSGLIAYREGKLVDAIKIWQKINEFHPEYTPSQVAIATAEQQIENLEKIAPDKAL